MMAATLLLHCLDLLELFSGFSGLSINSDKSGILLAGIWDDAAKSLFSYIDIKISSSYKYLGVKLGHVSPSEAFAPAMQKAIGRALSMRHSKLTLRERVFLLKICILPVLVYRSRNGTSYCAGFSALASRSLICQGDHAASHCFAQDSR